MSHSWLFVCLLVDYVKVSRKAWVGGLQRIRVQKSNFFRWKCGPWHFLTRHQNIAQKISAEQSSENRYLVFRSTNLQRETTTQQFGSKCSKCSGFLNMGRWVLSLLREAVGVFSACSSYLRRNSTKPWIVFSPNPPAAHSLEAGATQIRWFGRTPKTIVNLLLTNSNTFYTWTILYIPWWWKVHKGSHFFTPPVSSTSFTISICFATFHDLTKLQKPCQSSFTGKRIRKDFDWVSLLAGAGSGGAGAGGWGGFEQMAALQPFHIQIHHSIDIDTAHPSPSCQWWCTPLIFMQGSTL